MNTLKNALIVILSLTTIGSLYVAWQINKEVKVIKRVQTSLIASHAISAELATAQSKPPSLAPSTSKQIKSQVKTELNPARLLAKKKREAAKRARQSAEYKRLQVISRAGFQKMDHAALANKLNLTSEQRISFYAFLEEKSLSRSDVYAAARSQGLRDREIIQRLVEQQKAEIDQSMRESLGQEIFNAYQHYEESRSARHYAVLVEKRLLNSPNPLTSAQREQITEIMYRTRVQSADVSAALNHNPDADQMVLDTGIQYPRAFSQTGLAQSRGILSPDQYEALNEVAREIEARLKMSDLIAREIKKVTDRVP